MPNPESRRPPGEGASANAFDQPQSKASEAIYLAALRRARRENPEVLEGLKREATGRQWEVARRRVAGPIILADPALNARLRECIRRCEARGRGEAIGTMGQHYRRRLPYWQAA